MKNSLLISKTLFRSLEQHLWRNDSEQVAFILWSETDDNFLAKKIRYVSSDELIDESSDHAEVAQTVIAEVIAIAHSENLGIAEIHTHPFSKKGVKFSTTDFSGFESFVPNMIWRLHGRKFIALVAGRSDFDALLWDSKDVHDAKALSGFYVDISPQTLTNISFTIANELKRLERQRMIFGIEGQSRMALQKVAIVGLGGLGSIVAQELAYLGVRSFILIDGDCIERTNLNRLLGAFPSDIGRLKVDVMRDIIERLNPLATVEIVSQMLPAKEALDAIPKANFVFGCADNDGPRLELLSICAKEKIPFIDIASEIPKDSLPGGRMIFSGVSGGCLSCRSELSQEETRWYYMDESRREEHERIYGVDRDALGHAGPSVIPLNAIIASLGVTEFMAYCTGMRKVEPYLVYRGTTVHKDRFLPDGNCYYCSLFES